MNYIQPGTPTERLLFALRYNGEDLDLISQFCNKKHDQLLDLVIENIGNIKSFIDEGLSISRLHGLQDRGIDILIEYSDSYKSGISLKSPFDIDQADFSKSTKAQITEGWTYPDLEKYILLLCPCPDHKGAIEKCRILQALLQQSSDSRIKVIDPAVLASFLFSEPKPSVESIDDAYRSTRQVIMEESDTETLLDNHIRFRYLLCRNPKEAQRLLRDGHREHFPLLGPHTVVSTPTLENFLSFSNKNLLNRVIEATIQLASTWKEVEFCDGSLISDESRHKIMTSTSLSDLGSKVRLSSDSNEPVIKNLLDDDPLTRIFLEKGIPTNSLVNLFAYEEVCGGGGIFIVAEARQFELVILEVTALYRPVRNLSLYLINHLREQFDLGWPYSESEEIERVDQFFKYPPEILCNNECLLIPLYMGLAEFGEIKTTVIRKRTDVYSSATIGGEREEGIEVHPSVCEEHAVDANSIITPFGPTAELNFVSFLSRNGEPERIPARNLDRLNLLYVNQWLMAGSCPHLTINTHNKGWIELGTILDRNFNRIGNEKVLLSKEWNGEICIEEREAEITTLHEIIIEYHNQSKIRYFQLLGDGTAPVILKQGDDFLAKVKPPLSGEKVFLSITGSFMNVKAF